MAITFFAENCLFDFLGGGQSLWTHCINSREDSSGVSARLHPHQLQGSVYLKTKQLRSRVHNFCSGPSSLGIHHANTLLIPKSSCMILKTHSFVIEQKLLFDDQSTQNFQFC